MTTRKGGSWLAGRSGNEFLIVSEEKFGLEEIMMAHGDCWENFGKFKVALNPSLPREFFLNFA